MVTFDGTKFAFREDASAAGEKGVFFGVERTLDWDVGGDVSGGAGGFLEERFEERSVGCGCHAAYSDSGLDHGPD